MNDKKILKRIERQKKFVEMISFFRKKYYDDTKHLSRISKVENYSGSNYWYVETEVIQTGQILKNIFELKIDYKDMKFIDYKIMQVYM